jgi:hypothetical protein
MYQEKSGNPGNPGKQSDHQTKKSPPSCSEKILSVKIVEPLGFLMDVSKSYIFCKVN